MWRERVLKAVLVLVGLLFVAVVYPMVVSVLHANQSDTGETMMMSIYASSVFFCCWRCATHPRIAVLSPLLHGPALRMPLLWHS